jgi:transposase
VKKTTNIAETRRPRRHFSYEQKRALLDAAEAPGQSISLVAREYGIAPNLMFRWRGDMKNGEEKGLEVGENVVAESKLREAEKRIRELERALGRQTMKVEILEEAVRIGREKKLISPAALKKVDGLK